VQNTDPAVVTVNVGTTITYAQIDDPDLLPLPTAGRYEAVLTTPEQWVDLSDGEAVTTEELAIAAVDVFERYIDEAHR
jgi:hypothetical protein